VLHVALHLLVVKATTDEALGIKDGVGRVGRGLVLGGVADEALAGAGREADVGRSDTVALVVGDDLDTAVALDTAAGVEGSGRSAARSNGCRWGVPACAASRLDGTRLG